MRKIKFRAWDKEEEEYISWEQLLTNRYNQDYFRDHGKGKQTLSMMTDPFIELEQFTGLYDKNGKEIYEGDVLYGREEGDGETTAWTETYFQIVYDEKIASFMTRETKIHNSSWDEQICELNTEYEIIGNIHENPELLNA